ncbi:phage terminase large subunit [Sphingomonas sp. Leaf10]|uniref:phage terminase large subunit n=1 Tax=Sphingomonas sp. Leaf10 TaxID=1735676 RepID=UPI0006FEAE3B|nr:phage terminase large subunit [Sphingomonas sp. Leaf10]KQM37954.1 terminase [Sphingomonas sp. Leaf10]
MSSLKPSKPFAHLTLSTAELLALADDAQRELCRRSLAAFAKRAWPILEPSTELKWGWALDAICEHLEAVTSGEITRLLMNVPPGSMKSLLTGVIWPAWEWGPKGLPHHRFLATAHKQDLAVRDNLKCRRLIRSPWFQRLWPVALTSDQDAKTKFENSRTGFREAMAFTSMTGSRGDRVILDDPHSVDDANSPVKLAADITTFREALPSRVNNDQSAIVIVMQRLHEQDVSAVAVQLGYEHLMIPMRFEADRRCATSIGWVDPRAYDGELMFPERFPERQVVELETVLGSYATAGQLQQRPAPRSGGLFQRSDFEIVDAVPSGAKRTVRAWDFAATEVKAGRRPDWTVGMRVSLIGDVFYVEDVVRGQWKPSAVEQTLTTTASQDGLAVTVRMPQDPGAAGKADAATKIKLLKGYDAKAVSPTGEKSVRARPASAQAEAGNVKLVRGLWNTAFLDELCVFPAGTHDDQVDAFADAVNELALGATPYNIDAF